MGHIKNLGKTELFTLTFNYNEMELFSELHCRVKKRKIWKHFSQFVQNNSEILLLSLSAYNSWKIVNMRICWKFPVSKNWNIFSTHFIKYRCFLIFYEIMDLILILKCNSKKKCIYENSLPKMHSGSYFTHRDVGFIRYWTKEKTQNTFRGGFIIKKRENFGLCPK